MFRPREITRLHFDLTTFLNYNTSFLIDLWIVHHLITELYFSVKLFYSFNNNLSCLVYAIDKDILILFISISDGVVEILCCRLIARLLLL